MTHHHDGDEPLEDTELTQEELAEALATGNTIDVYLNDRLQIRITLASVDVLTRHTLDPGHLTNLADGLTRDRLSLALTPPEGPTTADPAELALLQRALAARASLVTAP